MKMVFNDVELLNEWLKKESEEGFNHKKITAKMQYGISCYTVTY